MLEQSRKTNYRSSPDREKLFWLQKRPRKGRKIRYAHRVPRDREKLAKRQVIQRYMYL